MLHILNGHSTLHLFEKAGIAGDSWVWPEILCEGESVKDFESESFWKMRGNFLGSFTGEPVDERLAKAKSEMENLPLGQYDEIILWFEYDLFCQINLLGALSWLFQKRAYHDSPISLVCLGKHPNYDGLVALGEIKPEEYPPLFEERRKLSQDDLAFADRMWETYCTSNHDQLLPIASNGHSHIFTHLKAALEKHLRRFPDPKTGLSEIEILILQHLDTHQGCSRRQLVGHMLRTQEIYGFGDLQYFEYLDKLAPLFTEKDEGLSLNEIGSKVLTGQQNFMRIRTDIINYGGANLNDFRYEDQQLVRYKE